MRLHLLNFISDEDSLMIHESDIEDAEQFDLMDVKLHDHLYLIMDVLLIPRTLSSKAVWFVVENYCQERVLEHETLTVA